ncbi:acyl-CoA dehydrogenase family protein [Albidovulum sp.]|uniref:acyl-CoA dehydrogenase family protein n=1 Tax=Albidovulum sp. TaxID=1872424 RepID=UPI001D6636CB|nr:acyl-CoA dehydrogenase family protein [Paracoccaceae bacterium]MCC0046609.1 acyl-CoA dehydrogenase family protein [Defluviimonas sp.]HPE25206.1 acyl-CoA dehydrogenase family protein [Albidovulum sp.]MCB2144288.1 acyl-CoA dehydrogenase family protein [Paracoccaceae bacterium]MCB2151904.1 acyl-CoA dehydrogenase family protein [Paracoccaceae bacterium]
MSVTLSHEDELLRASVRAFFEREVIPHEELVDRLGEVPEEIGREIEAKSKELGLFAANLPERVGGGGLNYTQMSIIEREFGRTSHALHSWVARPTELLLACEGDQVDTYLMPCVTGEKRELFGLTEPGAGSDAMGMQTRARKDGDDWILDGMKHFISAPTMADFAIVFAVTGMDETKRGPRKRITAFLVDREMPGVTFREGTKCVSNRGYKTYELIFDSVRLGPGQVLGEEGKGFELAGKWLGMGRVWIGATCCGKAERLIEMATDWCATRKQFGQPIGQFQATGFRLADMAIGLRTGDLLVADTVRRADQGIMTDSDAAMVKVYCSEMLNRVADDTVQIYGGMGLMEELPVQRMWRDARIERIWDGTSEIQRHIISRAILRPLGA